MSARPAPCPVLSQVSLVHLTEVVVSTHAECVIEVRALGPGPVATPGGGSAGGGGSASGARGSKVKITGLMISDEGGDVHSGKDLKSFGALDYVLEGLGGGAAAAGAGGAGQAGAAGAGGTFEIKNTWA